MSTAGNAGNLVKETQTERWEERAAMERLYHQVWTLKTRKNERKTKDRPGIKWNRISQRAGHEGRAKVGRVELIELG